MLQRRRVGGRGRQRPVVLDVHRPVATGSRRDQQVRLANPAARLIGGQPTARDERHPGPHGSQRRSLPPGPVLVRALLASRLDDHAAIRMQAHQPRDDLPLELNPPRHPPRHSRRWRQWLARPDEVPLSPDRTLLSRITTLRRHTGNVIAIAHGPIVTTPTVTPSFTAILSCHGPQLPLPTPNCRKKQQRRSLAAVCLSNDGVVLLWGGAAELGGSLAARSGGAGRLAQGLRHDGPRVRPVRCRPAALPGSRSGRRSGRNPAGKGKPRGCGPGCDAAWSAR